MDRGDGMTDTTAMRLSMVGRTFGCETAGDAWDLVLTEGWEHFKPSETEPWVVLVPNDDVDQAGRRG
jgi:hypothetical protein